MKDICSKCKIKELCDELPDDLSCDDVKKIAELDQSEPPKEET